MVTSQRPKGCTLGLLNKGHFGDDINSADLFFVERFSSLGGSNVLEELYWDRKSCPL